MTLFANISDRSSRQANGGGAQRSQPRNALLPTPQNGAAAGRAPAGLPPHIQGPFLRSAIGHAAVLSDTPEKWASTIELLKQHGIDPTGYEDFDEGRHLAIAASGIAPPSSQ